MAIEEQRRKLQEIVDSEVFLKGHLRLAVHEHYAGRSELRDNLDEFRLVVVRKDAPISGFVVTDVGRGESWQDTLLNPNPKLDKLSRQTWRREPDPEFKNDLTLATGREIKECFVNLEMPALASQIKDSRVGQKVQLGEYEWERVE